MRLTFRLMTPDVAADDIPLFPEPAPLPSLALDIAYQAPKRPVSRVLLCPSNTTDPGYDDISVIRADHMGSLGLKDVGVHIYVNASGQIQWGRGLEKEPEFPADAQADDLVILIQGLENSLSQPAMTTLRALLPIINAVHGNRLLFSGMKHHHSKLGIDRFATLVQPALQAPLE